MLLKTLRPFILSLSALFCVNAIAQSQPPASATALADQKFVESTARVEALKKAAEDLKTQLTRTETLLQQNTEQTALALKEAAIAAPQETLYRLMNLDQGACEITPIDGKPGEYYIKQTTREKTTRIRFKFAANNSAKAPTLKKTLPENMPPVYEYEQPEWMQDSTSGIFFSAMVKTVKTMDSTSQEIEQVIMAVYTGETQDDRILGFLQSPLPKISPVTCRALGQM